jgi:hypothetical protein
MKRSIWGARAGARKLDADERAFTAGRKCMRASRK